jgi:predicted PurR-regulated permease PerM
MFKNFLFTILLIFIFSTNLYSQDVKVQIEKSMNNLNQKLLLSEDQINSISKIIGDFFDKISQNERDTSKLMDETNNKIESFLDRKQKIKFDVIKKDWWDKLLERNEIEAISDTSQNK